MMNLLELKNVNFTYDGYKWVLQNINLSFHLGKVYGIFGKSGSGKTTLLSLMAGLEKVTSGDIFYQGTPLSKMNRDRYRSQQIGVIFQSYNLLPHLTALENVVLSIDISGYQVTNKQKYAIELLQKVGLDEKKAKRKILHLSGGEQQRVSIARALSYHPDVLLADEPTGNLDKETEQDIIELFKRLAHEEKKCVIIISHSTKVKEAVDELYRFSNGKIESA